MSARPHVPRLYVQVLVGIAAGVVLGYVAPAYGAAMKPLGDGFIKLVRMLIAPIVFSTVVVGIAQTGAMKEIGRIGARALLYFEAVSTIALIIGLIVARTLQPGAGMNFNPATADVSAVASYTTASKNLHAVDFILNVIPDAMIGGRPRRSQSPHSSSRARLKATSRRTPVSAASAVTDITPRSEERVAVIVPS